LETDVALVLGKHLFLVELALLAVAGAKVVTKRCVVEAIWMTFVGRIRLIGSLLFASTFAQLVRNSCGEKSHNV
jgi:hypothetical protein